MTADALRRLQALRGLTRVGSTHTVLAAVQGDLQTVIEAVLELAGRADMTSTDTPCVDGCGQDAATIERLERSRAVAVRQLGEALDRSERAEAAIERARDALDSVGVLHPVAADHVLRALDGPQDARSADSGTGAPPEPENGVQGRFGWLRVRPGVEHRYLMREVPSGWTDIDESDSHLLWHAEVWPRAEFTPIPTLADDEVAVKRGVVRMVAERLEFARRDALEDGRSATATALGIAIATFTDSLEADR